MTQQQDTQQDAQQQQTQQQDTQQQQSERMVPQSEVNRIMGEVRETARRTSRTDLLNELGVESEDDLRSGWTDYQQRRQQDETAQQRAERIERESQQRTDSYRRSLRTERVNNLAVSAALDAGIRPDRAADVVRLTDFGSVQFDDNDVPGADQVREAVNKTVERYKEWKSSSGQVLDGGFNPPDTQQQTAVKNPWSKKHLNLTEQGRLLRDDPNLAAKLKAAADAEQ